MDNRPDPDPMLDDARDLVTAGTAIGSGAHTFPPPMRGPDSHQPNQAAIPVLPRVTPPTPAPQVAWANTFASSMDGPQFGSPATWRNVAPKRRGRLKRLLGFVLLVALLGGAIGAGIMYGSDLMQLATGEDGASEPVAALAFPVSPVQPPVVRTATFRVETMSPAATSYEVTTDFATGIARVVVERDDQPTLEFLTLFDDAVVRRTDEPTWYRLARGSFPAGRDLGRARWVHTLDELLPPAIRSNVTIDRSTEAVLENETMRHLVVSVEPRRLAAPPRATGNPVTDDVAPADGATIADPTPPANADPTAVGPPVTAPTGTVVSDEVPAATLPAGMQLVAGTDPIGPVTIELWIDTTGLVRRVVLPEQLGGETVTVLSTSPDAWTPQFPTAEMVQPLTAAALFGLGL